MKQINLILISKDAELFAELKTVLEKNGSLRVSATDSTEQVRNAVKNNAVDALIVDDQLRGISGLDYIKELVRSNPFVNCALVSSLQPAEFHEATEGLGVFMQLAGRPCRQEADSVGGRIGDHLAKIYSLIST